MSSAPCDYLQLGFLWNYLLNSSFLRVVEMKKLYDREAYNRAHQRLKTDAVRPLLLLLSSSCNDQTYPQCGLTSSPPKYDWKACTQQSLKHENIDTRLQLGVGENGNEMKNALGLWALFDVGQRFLDSKSNSVYFYCFLIVFYILYAGSGRCSSQSGRLY